MQLFWYLSVLFISTGYFILTNGAQKPPIISRLSGLNAAATETPTPGSPFSWSIANAGCKNNYPIMNEATGVCLKGSNAYYQVFLGGLYEIYSVAIQGRECCDQWVKTYKLEYSLDGITFVDSNIDNPLVGNTNRNSEQTQSFATSVKASFLRWTPIEFHNYKSFRIEAYGDLISSFPDDPAIISQLNGLSATKTALSTVDSPFSFNVANGGCKNNWPVIQQATGVCLKGSNAYYQVYLGGLYDISTVALQGRGDCGVCGQYIKTYNLEYSLDGIAFIDNGINNPLPGNSDGYSLVFKTFGSSFEARFLRLTPITFNNYKSFRVEAYGNLISRFAPAIISTLSGLNAVTGTPTPGSPFSWSMANVGCKNNYPIIGKYTGVCIDNHMGSGNYYEVDLDAIYDIKTIAIQGRGDAPDQWVETYNLEYSLDGITFMDNGISNPLPGNMDRSSLRFKIFDSNSFEARFLRITPVSFNTYKSFRFEVYGEFIRTSEPSPSPTIATASPTYPIQPTFPPAERCQSNDVFHYQFILDESGSVTANNFNNYVKPFTSNIIQRDINYVSDISIIIYDSNIIELHTFDNTQQPRDEMLYKLNSRVYDTGNTHTGTAMQTGIQQFISKGYTENNIILLLTDGKTNSGINPCHSDITSALKDNGIMLIAIGIGVTINELGLNCADKIFELPAFTQNEFDEIIDELREITCIDCQYYQQVCGLKQAPAANNIASLLFDPQNDNENYPNYPKNDYKSYYDGIRDAVIVILVIGSIILCLYSSYWCLKKTPSFKYESVQAIQDA